MYTQLVHDGDLSVNAQVRRQEWDFYLSQPAATVSWNPGSIADREEAAKDITVTGAALGDFVLVSISVDTEDLALFASVTAANTVTAVLLNNTSGALDINSGDAFTLAALVIKPDSEMKN